MIEAKITESHNRVDTKIEGEYEDLLIEWTAITRELLGKCEQIFGYEPTIDELIDDSIRLLEIKIRSEDGSLKNT